MRLTRLKRPLSALGLALLIFLANPTSVSADATTKCTLYLPPSWQATAINYAVSNGAQQTNFTNSGGNGSNGFIATMSGGDLGTGTFLVFWEYDSRTNTIYNNGDVVGTSTNHPYYVIPITGGDTLDLSNAVSTNRSGIPYLGVASCFYGVNGANSSGFSNGLNDVQTKFPYTNSTPSWVGMTFETTQDVPPVPCQYNSTILASDPACTAPPPDPPPATTPVPVSYDDLRLLLHEYALKASSLAISLFVSYIIIKQFRWRSNV